MNSLSWFLYWAEVAPNLSRFAGILGFILFVVSAICTLCYVLCRQSQRKIEAYPALLTAWQEALKEARTLAGNSNAWIDAPAAPDKDDQSAAAIVDSMRIFPFLMVLFFLMWASCWFVPSKETFYLIATSEAGQTIAQQATASPEFGKLRTILNDYLDDQIKNKDDKDDKDDDKKSSN